MGSCLNIGISGATWGVLVLLFAIVRKHKQRPAAFAKRPSQNASAPWASARQGGRRESLKRYIVEAELQPTRLPPQRSGIAGDEGCARSARDYNPRTPVSNRSTSSGVV